MRNFSTTYGLYGLRKVVKSGRPGDLKHEKVARFGNFGALNELYCAFFRNAGQSSSRGAVAPSS